LYRNPDTSSPFNSAASRTRTILRSLVALPLVWENKTGSEEGTMKEEFAIHVISNFAHVFGLKSARFPLLNPQTH
jgi:hypothetical protein